jgi:hypothetical protein
MNWTVHDVVSARDMLARLFEEIGLADYLFGVEPVERGWQVRVECRCRDGSHATSFGVAGDALTLAHDNLVARRGVRRFLSEKLGDCIRAARSAADLAEDFEDEDEPTDVSTLGSLSEFSSTAGGMQRSRTSSAPPAFETHRMSHVDGPDATRGELHWYALEQATQDPHPRAVDLECAEEAALHLVPDEAD